jgi:tetratricopeptide (TPR) repeat protein
MPELLLQRNGDMIDVIFGEHRASIPLADVALNEEKIKRIYEDAVAYGRDLFNQTFRDEQMRMMLASLPANERLVLVADDPLVASIPWEYLRDQNGKLLAARLNFVRGIPQERRRESFLLVGPLEIVAIPVSPVDEPRVLNTEREWRDLVEAVTVTSPLKSVTLKRVRPPTRNQMERSLGRQETSIVHFMGHSASRDGKALLAFEDARARSHLIDAADFADSLNTHVFLVVLNSCLSAFVSSTESGTVTEFGNIARTLVHQGIPYALGMQFEVPDNAALVLSRALYDFLLQEHSVEEAVMHTRRALEEPGKLSHPHWLAGIPVLYTSLHVPAPPINLAVGQPAIQPDAEQLENTCDLTALPPAEHFIGRGSEISQALDALLAPGAHGFVLLHGLGGIGKTATARAVAERVGWHYQDRVLAISFETFASIDPANQLTVNEQFADRFYNRMARFFGLDPAQYPFPVDLQQAILQRRAHLRSLLVLDNIETLVDTQRRNHPGAVALSSFISRLKEGDGAVLFTSRMVPPSDWGDCKIVSIPGLSDEAGAALFLALLPADREHLASLVARQALSQRVQGHPLSIRLLAGRFADETATDLATFLEHIEGELEAAEQKTPTSIEDPERQRTLYACIDYSAKRLTPEQREVLDAASLFQAPFLPQFVADVLNDKEQTLVHLQNLVRLSLLEISAQTRTFQEGELVLLELHPMLRWYIQHRLTAPDMALLERYGEVYAQLARTAYDAYDNDSRLRYLVRQSLPDFEAALRHLPPLGRSALAFNLAIPYQRLGQNRHALELYEEALENYQELGDVSGVAMAQLAMARLLVHLGKPQAALALYEQAFHTYQELGDVHNLATTQQGVGDTLTQLGKPQEALIHLEQALHAYQELGEVSAIAITQASKADALAHLGKSQEALSLYEHSLRTDLELGKVRNLATTHQAMAHVLQQLGRLQEALTLYEQVLHTNQELGDIRSVATTQLGMAHVLMQLGKPQEALTLYEQVLCTTKEMGDVQGLAASQKAMADVLVQLGKPQEAMALYEQSLGTDQELGNARSVALTQSAIADVLVQLGKPQEAMALYEQSLRIMQELGDMRGLAAMQHAMANVLVRLGKPQEAMALYEQSLGTDQELGDVLNVAVTQHAMADVLVQLGKPQEALKLYEQSLRTTQELGNVRSVGVTQHAMADVLVQLGKPQEAMVLYEQALRTTQELGDVRSVAATQANYCQLLLQQGEHHRALSMAWEAYNSLHQSTFTYDEQVVQQLLISIKGQVFGPVQFDTLWKEVISETQPDWLCEVQVTPFSEETRRAIEQMNMFVANTITVMTEMPEKREEWREKIGWALQKALSINRSQDAEFFTAILAILDNQSLSLPVGHPYAIVIDSIQASIAAGGLDGKKDALPFDVELIPRSIAALLGGPQKKMEHAQYLTMQAAQTTDEGLKALIHVIQLALFSKDLSQPGRDLKGVYQQVWEAIVVGVESGGVDPRMFGAIINNTLAVLGPASHQRSEWRNNLVELRNQSTTMGDRNMVALLDAAIGLLDAGGNPTGLGDDLKGIYAKTWHEIVGKLPGDIS